MKTSNNGKKIIKAFEGFRARAYLCPAGILTIGYGHTGPDVKSNIVISKRQAELVLSMDLDKFESCINSNVETTLSQNQFDALVSFVFNVGCGAFKQSTMLKLLNAGLHDDAAQEFLKWNKARSNGLLKVSPGLNARRESEKELFLGPQKKYTMKEQGRKIAEIFESLKNLIYKFFRG